MATVHHEPPLDLQLLKAARQRKFLARRVHEHTSHCRFGPLQVLRNVRILSRKGERMPLGLRKSAPRKQLRTAMTRRPKAFQKCAISARTRTSSDLISGNPFMLFHYQPVGCSLGTGRLNIPDQANTMKAS
jgi:hypothetical protein